LSGNFKRQPAGSCVRIIIRLSITFPFITSLAFTNDPQQDDKVPFADKVVAGVEWPNLKDLRILDCELIPRLDRHLPNLKRLIMTAPISNRDFSSDEEAQYYCAKGKWDRMTTL